MTGARHHPVQRGSYGEGSRDDAACRCPGREAARQVRSSPLATGLPLPLAGIRADKTDHDAFPGLCRTTGPVAVVRDLRGAARRLFARLSTVAGAAQFRGVDPGLAAWRSRLLPV